MSTILLILEYDGTGFHGWQRQAGARTVQQDLEGALARLQPGAFTLLTSSRTDAGVHAAFHPVAFRTDSPLPLHAYLRGLNSLLPADLCVRQAAWAQDDFEPRRSALGKTYRYLVWNARTRRALLATRSWHVPVPLDVETMATAARHFLGEHDLSAFRASHCDSHSTMRLVQRLDVERAGDLVTITIRANAFLRNMARIIVGTLVEVGRGAQEPGWIPELIAGRDRTRAGRTAPPQGLCLERVHYPRELFLALEPEEGLLTEPWTLS